VVLSVRPPGLVTVPRFSDPVLQRFVFAMALLVAFIILSLLSGSNATGHVTGTVAEWQPEQYIALARGPIPGGRGFPFQISLRKTVYEGDTHNINPGARVTVWYRNLGERHLVADRVRVLEAVPR
jgi:hypothetical protein